MREEEENGGCLLEENRQEDEVMETEDIPGERQSRELFPTDSFFASGDVAELSSLATIVSR